MTELKLVPTDNLINELLSRYDHAVFSGMKCLNESKESNNFYQSKWVGNYATCIGLAARAEYVINKEAYEESEPESIDNY